MDNSKKKIFLNSYMQDFDAMEDQVKREKKNITDLHLKLEHRATYNM